MNTEIIEGDSNKKPSDEEIAKIMQDKIDALKKWDIHYDLMRGKGVTLDKNVEIGQEQKAIEEEISKLKKEKSKLQKPL